MQCDGLNLVELRYVDYPSTLLLRMNELRLAGQFCDVTVEVDGLQFRAHRSVLASASKLFENLFSQQPQASKLFRLDFLSSKAFGLVLEFLYTASLKVEVEALESLRSAAHILQLGPLEQVCSLVLQQATTSPTDETMFDGLSSSVNEMVMNVTVGAGNCGDGESAPRNACERTYGDVGADELSANASGLSTIERQLVSLSQESVDGLCEETPACQLVGMLEEDTGGQDNDEHLENQNLAQVIVLPVDGFVEQQSAVAAVEALPEPGEGIERIEVEDVAEAVQPDLIEREQPAAPPPRAHVPNQCFVCRMVVTSSAELGSHLWKEHLLFNEGECKMCGKVVSSKSAAQKHLLYHSGEMKLSCSTCGEGFAFKQDLLLHKRNAHGRGKPYMCDECGRVFFSNGNFLRHQRIAHKGLKPHECTQCGRSFVDGGNLARHLKRHTGDLSYPCDKCDKIFGALCHLNEHSRTHNVGIKPYECKVCSRRCRSFASMRNHISRHGGDHQAFRCSVCTFGSPSSRKMQQHVTEYHKSDLSDAWNIEQTHMFILHDM